MSGARDHALRVRYVAGVGTCWSQDGNMLHTHTHTQAIHYGHIVKALHLEATLTPLHVT